MTYRSKSCPPTPRPSRRAERQADVMAVGNAAAPSTRDPDPYLLRFRRRLPWGPGAQWRVAWGHGCDGDEPCLALPARALSYATPTASTRLLPPPGRLLLSCFLDLARHPSRRRCLLSPFFAPRRPRPPAPRSLHASVYDHLLPNTPWRQTRLRVLSLRPRCPLTCPIPKRYWRHTHSSPPRYARSCPRSRTHSARI